ncbi:hypothetical protein [Novosphingobium sp.]|uniref:PAS domain-containing protein n=1 Tax=Novosphingobium sp. TaxID=1874826 RepID=UPI00286A48FC|nr:hypothetical protein [Novosphingobium sp.]
MDTYRGRFGDHNDEAGDWPEIAFGTEAEDEEELHEAPPSPVGQDERRMQVRAYNHWASLLDGRNFPSIEDLDAEGLPDFGPYSVLLDFTGGIENPSIQFLGDKLAVECGAGGEIETLSDVPARSLLSRITDHYMQIIANQAPIGFEAEFINQRDHTILYRGILLPFSSDDDTIDFIYGVINWKELADQQTTDALMREIDQALELEVPPIPQRDLPLTDWADGPADTAGLEPLDLGSADFGSAEAGDDDGVFDLAGFAAETVADPDDVLDLTVPADQPEVLDDAADMALADYLASARALAEAARGSEDRTRHALYAAIGRAYDFALAAEALPGDFAELVADSGLTVQDRAPMTPVVKLVFGAEYDKTRLTEYASALSHAQRIGLARGELTPFLSHAAGGLKGVVAEERRFKRSESGKPDAMRDTPREALAKKLRQLAYAPLDSVADEGSEFTLLVARRLPSGEVVLLGEVSDDVALIEKAARKLI